MTEYELLRILTFLEKVRAPFQDIIPFSEEDPAWNILIFLMKSHISGRTVTISMLASASRASYGSAMRRIHGLIEEKYIVRIPHGPTGRSFVLEPSPDLVADFTKFAGKIKSLLAETFGLRRNPENEADYYFGGSYFAAQVILPPRLLEGVSTGAGELRFLLHDDNYFRSMRDMWSDFRNNIASREHFTLLPLKELYQAVTENAARDVSDYDIIAIDMPWLGRIVQADAVRELGGLVGTSEISPMDFHPSVWSTGLWDGNLFGIPIYCTIELLAARSDWFEADQLRYPQSFSETLTAARHFHAPAKDRYGIVWNGAAGRPIAQTFMILMGCCGRNILDQPPPRFHVGDTALLEDTRPNLLTDSAFAALEYLHRLLEVSPQSILHMGWTERTNMFMTGKVALAYCWTHHAARCEYEVGSVVKRKVKYLPQPRGPGGLSSNPIGGFLLCIPKNLPEARMRRAFDAIAWMASPEAMKAHVKNGFPLAPRFSVSADPEAAASSPIVSVVDRLAKKNLLTTWQRPSVSRYLRIEELLGQLIHEALSGDLPDRQALQRAQAVIDDAFRETKLQR